MTASFRASAIRARFGPARPRNAKYQSFSGQSGALRAKTAAAITKWLLVSLLPFLVIPSVRETAPD